ncbi:hypothetical protein BaRGS_00019486 [Batillaria attramentaria]|uniref:Uncharacterized protein n=1 Tax=Batillaria attramentaria TaxID=370345 RepID=A0ABD0KQ79_9CAEN
MGLYNEMGELLESQSDALRSSGVTISDDITIASPIFLNKITWIQPGNKRGQIDSDGYCFSVACKNMSHGSRGIVVKQYVNSCDGEYCEVSFESLQPLKWKTLTKLGKFESGFLLDASSSREYFATQSSRSGAVDLFRKAVFGTSSTHDSTYTPGKDMTPSDACFCLIDGREMLVVAVEKDNKVHVVDHTDGCLFVRYLNTEPFTLDRPRCLATDYNHRLWIGCHGGKVILVYL